MIVAPQENHTVVMAPYVGAPAFNAGIRPGDVIVKVDDKSTDGMTTSEVADMLKGPKGTVVKITIAREGFPEQFVFTVTRDEIPRRSVDIAFMLKPGIGYIRFRVLQRNHGSRNFRLACTNSMRRRSMA